MFGDVRMIRGALALALLFGTPSLAEGQTDKGIRNQAMEILSRRCITCHQKEKQSGGLNLSVRSMTLAHPNALVVGKPQESLVWKRVQAGTMPPNGKLPASEIAVLEKWIMQGAEFEGEPLSVFVPGKKPLWSFQPLKITPLPTSRFQSLSQNPLDRFLFAKMQERGLTPSALTSKLALLRRVTVDLTGLPPTLEEIHAFLKDTSPTAYERVVDRLLASPAYGERWGRHWLDVVRYGESHGYEQNHLRPNAWVYRDYVIRAFNTDKPYNQFVLEQLAGDVIGKGKPEVEPATGFLVAGTHDTVGSPDELLTRQQRANDLDDMVTTVGATFLGVTIGCAKCHDHKFDPLAQKDYYRMAAAFADVHHGEAELTHFTASPEQQQKQRECQMSLERLKRERQGLEKAVRGTIEERKASLAPLNVAQNEEPFPPTLARFVRMTIRATRGDSEPCIDEFEVFGSNPNTNLALSAKGAKATASSLLPGFAIHQIEHLNDGLKGNAHSWISGERGTGWIQIELPKEATLQRVVWGRDGDRQFEDRLPIDYEIAVSQDAKNWKVVSSHLAHAANADNASESELALKMAPEQRKQYASLLREIREKEKQLQSLMERPKGYIGQFGKADPVYLLKRGDVMQRLELVSAGTPAQIRPMNSPLSTEQNPRLSVAKWLIDPANPVTARVMVNRIWAYHFGRGIVGTPSDFGNNGEPPSHPELLDWLANDFMTHGWKIKRLHRMIVLSYAYRQATADVPANSKKDGDNRYLWRMPLRRMEAEAIRDAILLTSGKLDRQMGGPSYRLFNYDVVNVAIYTVREEQGKETWRRCVYQQPARGIRDVLLGTFDCPDSSERTAKRTSTTTALQALSLMNGRFLQEQAEYCAERVRNEAGSAPQAQIEQAFRRVFGRTPSRQERQEASALVSAYGLNTLLRALLNANEFLYY